MAKPQIDLKFGADLKDFRKGISNIDRSLSKLSGGFTALGATIGASFAVDAIRQFVSESVELGATMEGVRGAFERFADPSTLDNLRDAVSGTVDDLKLMQMAVRAKNFKIPMDVLAKGLQFATKRAVETGESVDYLVESFVIGLGRESVKILDNLGISTLEIQRKTKELGDMTTAVGAIMDEEFSKSGERVETTSMKIDQQRAAVTNLKTEIGEKLAPVYMGVVQGGLEFVKALTKTFEQFSEGYSEMFRALFNLRSEQDRFGKSISDTGKKRIQSEEKSLFRLNAMLSSLQDANLAEDQRAILIKKINTEYKDYLPNLLSEKTTLEEIRDVSRQVNQTAREKINQIIYQEKINKATENGVQAQKDLNDLTMQQSQMVARGGYYAMTAEQLRELAQSGQNLGHDFNSAASRVVEMNNALDDARGRLSRSEMIIEGYTKMLNGSSVATEKLGDKTDETSDDIDGLGDSLEKVNEEIPDLNYETQELEKTTENFGDTFDHSFRNAIEKFKEFRDEFMMLGDLLRVSFEAAFAPLEEGETRLGNFREVFVRQLQMMAAQLLATAAAAAILAAILTVAFGGANLAGQAMFGKAGMGFGDLFKGFGGFGFNSGGMGGGSNGIEIFGRLSGADILLSGERAGRNRNRQRGF